MDAVSAGVSVLLTVGVALVAFHVGREAGRVDRAHAGHLSRQLHPAHSRAIVDQPAGESVRIVRDGITVYDWAADDDMQGGTPRGTDT